VIIGIVAVVVIAMGQLGGKSGSSGFSDPGIDYPTALQHGNKLGDPTAPVTLEVYGDFQCPICSRHSLTVEPTIFAKYVPDGRLQIVHHDIAILSSTPDMESERATRGGYCAQQQGKYWDYAHWVFNNQEGENEGGFARDRLIALAGAAGLDQGAFDACLDSAPAAQALADTQAAANALGINSTPTMAINGALQAPGLKTVDQLSALIDAALASASPAASGAASPAASPAASGSAAP
jgi:protein-disulfide isomerase